MKRRYAMSVNGEHKKRRTDEDWFKGYVCYTKMKDVKPLFVNNGVEEICVKNNGFEWLEVYPDNSNYAITIMFDDKTNIIEWYFDISKEIGIENGIPYEDDLYLDMVITPDGQELILDEDELKEACEEGKITQEDVKMAYQVLEELENKYAHNFDYLVDFTKRFYKFFDNKKQEVIIRRLNKEKVIDNLDNMFNIISTNMNKIFKTGNTEEEDYQTWKKSMISHLNDKKRRWIGAFYDNNLIGYLLYRVDDVIYLDEIQIVEEYQQDKCTFRKLMKFLLQENLSDDYIVRTYVNKKNDKSNAIVKRMGFKLFETTENGYRYSCSIKIIKDYFKNR